ncbi:MAG: HEAT repeat domain-containing protein [Spirochaetes bacterium]|nr:HEAT repeat domain-containing protein [Spirochaetota bacterium]
MKTHFLSQNERQTGFKYFMVFTLFNGLGFGFLADTTVYLLAIHFGASNIQLGIISSLIYLSGILLLVSPTLLSGHNMITVYFWSWLFRGLVCLIYALTLFFTGQIAVFIIIGAYALFCTVRIIGVSLYNPMIQMLSTPSTLGNIITGNNARFNLGNIFGKIASFFVVSIPFLPGLYRLLSLQGIGIVFNTIAAFYLLKIPCREKIERSKEINVLTHLFRNILNKKRIIPLLMHWNYVSVVVIFGFSIPLLKKILLLEQNIVFLYTIIVAVSITLSMYLIKPIIDRISTKPVVFITSFLDIIFFILWALVKKGIPLYLVFILGAAAIFVKGINQSMIGRNLISSIPQKDKVTYNSMISFFAGIIAFSIGLIAGFAADIGEKHHPWIFNPYYMIFIFASFLSAINIFLNFFIEEKEHQSLTEIAEVFLSFRNIKTLMNIHTFETTADPQKRQLILLSLKYSSSPVVLNEIKKILKNPLSSETEEVLKSLFTKPRPRLLPDILEIAKDKGSYHRATAIFALGAYPYPKVEKELIGFLDDEDVRIKSNAAKSLARINNKDYMDRYIELLKDSTNSIWDIMNYMIAIFSIDEKGKYLSEIFDISDFKDYDRYRQSVLSMASKLLNLTPELSNIYQMENMENLNGIRFMLDELRQLDPFYKDYKLLLDFFKNESYEKIWDWTKETLKKFKYKEPYVYFYNSIMEYDNKKYNKSNTIAAVYFAFFILLNNFS